TIVVRRQMEQDGVLGRPRVEHRQAESGRRTQHLGQVLPHRSRLARGEDPGRRRDPEVLIGCGRGGQRRGHDVAHAGGPGEVTGDRQPPTVPGRGKPRQNLHSGPSYRDLAVRTGRISSNMTILPGRGHDMKAPVVSIALAFLSALVWGASDYSG